MYQRNSLITKSKWFFLLAIVLLVAYLISGVDHSKVTWMNDNIVATQAQLTSQEIISNQNFSELDLEQKNFYVDLETQQPVLEEQRQIQLIQSIAVKNREALEFQKNIRTLALFTLRVLGMSLGLGVFVATVLGGIGLNRYLTAKAQTKYSLSLRQQTYAEIDNLNRHLHTLQDRIAAIERRIMQRATQADIKKSTPIWPERNDDLTSNNYPWIN